MPNLSWSLIWSIYCSINKYGNKKKLCNYSLICCFNTEAFGASEEKEKCEESCPQPCHRTEYETSLSYADLQRNVFIKKLNSFNNETENFEIYEQFINMSHSDKKEFIE